MEVSDKELSEMIADLSLTDNYPARDRLCHALIELRDLRRRWAMFAWCFPWMDRWMVRLSRRKRAPSIRDS
jgi:hypothetical protein